MHILNNNLSVCIYKVWNFPCFLGFPVGNFINLILSFMLSQYASAANRKRYYTEEQIDIWCGLKGQRLCLTGIDFNQFNGGGAHIAAMPWFSSCFSCYSGFF